MRMMTRVGIVLTLAVGLIAADAMAWGPRAKRSISGMALQVIKKDFPNVFRPSGVTGPNFEEDLLRGANDGYAILGAEIPLNNDAEVVQAIANQIQLLRDVRKAGPSSYFAYRMGVLAALTADVTLPFGFAWSADDQAIQAKVNEDTEMRLDGFGYAPHQEHRIFLRDPREYFAKARMFYAEDKKIILEDYTRGQGYDGFLAQGGKAYFGRAVEAVSDVWYSVLRPEEEPGQVPATQRTLAWYYVDEIKYLLQAKHNLTQAEKQRMFDLLEENALPSNKFYKYDFFYDNCATRVRDILENTLGENPGYNTEKAENGITMRQLLHKYLPAKPWLGFGIDLILGVPADKTASIRDYMFLPDYLYHFLGKSTTSGGQNITVQERMIPSGGVYPPLPQHSIITAPLIATTLVSLAGFFFLFREKGRKYFDTVFWTVLGTGGIIIALLWFATDHTATKVNLNLLWMLPTHLALPFLKSSLWKIRYLYATGITAALLLAGWVWLPQQLPVEIIPVLLLITIKTLFIRK